ncbi:hypothetical protein LY90DRAFT_699942 [Neocallimastix californiae]|uniref:NAD(P)-binding domain-containing protein n=1 Tax=Neocallimastix californiae TaxID=1754190 RepID=A0A1Y2ELN2_9FUNG|nr:hypothetical protein LY90DRAFT_699942 [Neocallimastix californiae]|eukprot:ORY72463.1 hypothetical protein LY90DRAFT_699942 [Neocallimastix californiae]
MASFKALVFGASGAVGRELVDNLINSNDYSKVSIIVRRKIEKWENQPSEKLNIIIVESLDFLINDFDKIKEYIPDIDTYTSVFNTLGSRVKNGEELFRKVEYTYVLKSLEIAEKFGIPHFSFCSSNKAHKDSKFLLWKTKGETEEELKKRKIIKKISVFHPGLLLDRDNDKRLGEAFSKWIPFTTKIAAKDVAKAMFVVDLKFNLDNKNNQKVDSENIYEVIENDEMLKIVQENQSN